MKKTLIFAISLTAAMCASAAVTITVDATMAPNAYGSPSWNAWIANGFYAVENGLSSYGPAGPTQFNVTTSPLPVAANFVTGFPSWMGQADPAAPYNNELGTRASFVGVINGNGSLINMNNFGITLNSTDAGNALGVGCNWPNNSILPGDWTYDQYDIGLIFNNGRNISGGYTIVNSGDPGQLVNEIISIGAGNAYAGYVGDIPGDPTATDQQVINYDLASVQGYDFTGAFAYGAATGSATFDFSAVPEPTTMIAGALLLLPFGASTLRGLRRNRTS
jgi:hypothetical protein